MALQTWDTEAAAAFGEIENAHTAVGGKGPGRRFLTQQINYAYVTLLAARFQGFSRALHTQTADSIAAGTQNVSYRVILLESLTLNRSLDRHNAQPNAIADDYDRFGIDAWGKIDAVYKGNDERRKKLWALITWRNAIAHDDIDAKLARQAVGPSQDHTWNLQGLAKRPQHARALHGQCRRRPVRSAGSPATLVIPSKNGAHPYSRFQRARGRRQGRIASRGR